MIRGTLRRCRARMNEADPLIAGVGDIQIAQRIKTDSHRTGQLCALRWPSVAAQTRFAGTHDNSYRAVLELQAADLMRASFGEA